MFIKMCIFFIGMIIDSKGMVFIVWMFLRVNFFYFRLMVIILKFVYIILFICNIYSDVLFFKVIIGKVDMS